MEKGQQELVWSMADALRKARGGVGLVALLALIWGALRFFQSLVKGVHRAWHHVPLPWWKLPLKNLVMMAIVASAMGIGLAAPALLQAAGNLLLRFQVLLSEVLPGIQWHLVTPALTLGQFAISGALLFYAITALYILAPGRKILFREVWIPALLSTLFMQLGQVLFGHYAVRFIDYNAIYGSVGALMTEEDGKRGPVKFIEDLKSKGHLIAYVGDVVGTGSSRKSATNSAVWATGEDIPYVPNKRFGGVTLGGKIAPIYFNTQEDSGSLPIEVDVGRLEMGDVIDIYPYAGKIERDGAVIETFQLRSDVLLDEVQAGGRINLIIGRSLTAKALEFLGLPAADVFRLPVAPVDSGKGYTVAQKMVGRACGMPVVDGNQQGIRPGTYCEPKMTTVGSQDTTGPMTRDELKDLACLGFSSDLVMQSFCHTAAYPKPVDVKTHHELPHFMSDRGGVALRPGDGVIHSWLNRLLLPDTVGTGGDSHTRFPIGISFPAGSGLVAFAAATGVMPLDMPESVLVRFKGVMQPGITLRDLVHAIPYFAIKQGLLTVAKAGKVNAFSGRVIEIEGLPQLKVEQAFELSDATAERSAAGCTVKLDKEPVMEYMQSNIVLMKNMIANGYSDARTLRRRIEAMEKWLATPELLEADADADYAEVIEIDLADIKEPIVCCPNDPDDAKLLSEVAGNVIEEVFIGSCMTNIGHFRAASKLLEGKRDIPVKLWVAPPTKMDADELTKEGHYGVFGAAGARMEMPGCSLCMGNQAQVREGATVMSTSTRNFPNRLGKNSFVYLGSAELAAVCSRLGRIPTIEEYLEQTGVLADAGAEVYRYMNFNEIDSYVEKASTVTA